MRRCFVWRCGAPALASVLLGITMTTINWTEQTPMPQAEAGGAAGFASGQLILAGGTAWQGEVKQWLDTVQVYDVASRQWRTGARLPRPVAYGPAVSIDNGIEVFGGTDGTEVRRTSWRYDTAKAAWHPTGEVPADVLLGRAARIGERVYLLGGCRDAVDLTTCRDAVWERDAAGAWHKASAIPGGPVALPAVATSGNRIFLFGGCSMPEPGKVVNHARAAAYDVGTKQWESLPDLPAANRGLSAVAVNDQQIYVLGGYTDIGLSAAVWIYHVRERRYEPASPLPVPLLGTDFFLYRGTLYGAGGEDRIRGRSARLLAGQLNGGIPR
jgi:N-acetylneuraminic acid mutarotase